jgi:hypothetical protein
MTNSSYLLDTGRGDMVPLRFASCDANGSEIKTGVRGEIRGGEIDEEACMVFEFGDFAGGGCGGDGC